MEVDIKKWVNLDRLDSNFVQIEYIEEVKKLAKEANSRLLYFPLYPYIFPIVTFAYLILRRFHV